MEMSLAPEMVLKTFGWLNLCLYYRFLSKDVGFVKDPERLINTFGLKMLIKLSLMHKCSKCITAAEKLVLRGKMPSLIMSCSP